MADPNPRRRLMVELLARTGMRVGELAALIAPWRPAFEYNIEGYPDARFLDLVETVAPEPVSPPPAGMKTWRIGMRFQRHVLVNGSNPLLLLDEVRALGACEIKVVADAVPDLQDLEPSGCYFGWDATLVTDRPRSEIDDVFLFIADEMELRIEDAAPEATTSGRSATVIRAARFMISSCSVLRGRLQPSWSCA